MNVLCSFLFFVCSAGVCLLFGFWRFLSLSLSLTCQRCFRTEGVEGLAGQIVFKSMPSHLVVCSGTSTMVVRDELSLRYCGLARDENVL